MRDIGGHLARVPLLLVLSIFIALSAGAQDVLDLVEHLEFDRPEAWAMKYFASVMQPTGFSPSRPLEPGAWQLGMETITIPRLDAEQRRIGFNGTKEEDLNKLPALVRPRVSVGLPHRFVLTATWVPPIGVGGIRSDVFGAALERALVETKRLGLSVRMSGMAGTIEGDFTCPEQVLPFEPGSPRNTFGCESRSSDRATLRGLAAELIGARRIRSLGGPILQLGVSANHFDTRFQVNARTFGYLDRTLLLTEGTTWSTTASSTWPLTPRVDLGIQTFYSPLEVRRAGRERSTDPLVNFRLLIGYRLR